MGEILVPAPLVPFNLCQARACGGCELALTLIRRSRAGGNDAPRLTPGAYATCMKKAARRLLFMMAAKADQN
jgi:hypothetical protein